MSTDKRKQLDRWIRGPFKAYNTELEELYFASADPMSAAGKGEAIKRRLCEEGRALILALVQEGNTDEGFEDNFSLLGDVGFYMGACTRHEITAEIAGEAAQLREAAALSMELGACLGVAPRFSSSHLMTHNSAQAGVYKSFTTLADELLFIECNTLGVLRYKAAADALMRILSIDISHPMAYHLLLDAKAALTQVAHTNQALFQQLDAPRFFYNVRPYYKSYKVGFTVWRGANAGDFAGINVIDLLLGLCQPSQAEYSQLLVDKFLFMLPQEQLILRDMMRQKDLMTRFVAASQQHPQADWLLKNLSLFIEVCQIHGRTGAQHHDELVEKYIVKMAHLIPTTQHTNLTASGPPLPVLLKGLEKLRDQRLAAPRTDIPTRYQDLQYLIGVVKASRG